jgi:membrane fusion protein (multidrug efflux system)
MRMPLCDGDRSARRPIAALSACALLALACGDGAEAGAGFEPGPITVETMRVESEQLRDVATFSGQLGAEHSVMLEAETAGLVEEILFEEGRAVTAGDILFRLKDDEQVARVREAQANLALARDRHERTLELAKRSAVAEAQRDQVDAELAVAEARLELARVELAKTRVRAPFDGVAGLRLVSPGDHVEENDPLVQVDAVDRLQVSFAISELGILFTRVGTPVEVRVAPYPGEVFPGEVFFVSPTLDPATRRILAKAWIPNPAQRLRAGLFASVDMQVDQRENAILVPETAVVFDRRGTYVWRIDDEQIATRIPVETGLRREGRVEISLGLRPGDRIVTAGTHKVQEGKRVVAAAPRPSTEGQARRSTPGVSGEGT